MQNAITSPKHAEYVPLPNSRSAIIARAAAGLGMTVSEFINRTLGSTLPEPQPEPQPEAQPATQP